MPVRTHRWNLIAVGLLWTAGVADARQADAPVVPQPVQSTDLPRALFIATMDAEFRRRDADGDGFITAGELQQFEADEAVAAARRANRDAFARLDSDADGALSPEEFAALVGPVPSQDVSPQMARLDSNRDQKVGLVEYRAATLAAFDRLDTDLDGVVTAAEMEAGRVVPAAPGR